VPEQHPPKIQTGFPAPDFGRDHMIKIMSWKATTSTLIFILIVVVLILVAGCAGPPIASFSVDGYVTAVGTPVQFLDNSTGEVTSWLWDFGDGNSSTEQNPSHVYAKKGDFSATLTVLNKAGNSTTKTNIGVLQTPVAGLTAENVALVGESIQFTSKSSGDITSYSWDFGDGGTSTEQDPSHAYNSPVSFTVSLKVSNQLSDDTKIMQVKILQPAKADFYAPTKTTQTGSTIQFADKSSGDITSYSWDFGDGGTSTEQDPSHAYNSPGNFTVSLKVSNQLSADTKTMQVKILGPAKANFSVTTTTQTGSIIQFADTSSGDITSYSWDFGDGGTSTEQNPSHSYNTAGTYQVTLTVSNDLSFDTTVGQVQVMATSLSVDLIMCSSVTSDKIYTVKPDATYNNNDPIYVYLEVKGFQQYHTNDGFEFWVQLQSLKLFKPDGSILLNLSDVLEKHATTIDAPLYVYFWYFLGDVSPTNLAGEYRLECYVLDKQSGDSKAAFTNFVVKLLAGTQNRPGRGTSKAAT
jgi:PKD repeat protein